ncbi:MULTISPECIES: outer membrane beta-barrel protein [Methylococcus]|uniref:Outer membrane beta-barrel protein n=1 Tax=Methylococcus capsulatus TaxID=414 RepID=A0ABZ2F385_METCP|nr:outer membrane beta-barrel protein [Methylococcus capsulatus]MDF9393277.1 hypothetical protein [Methylococcus capsulatus]
MSRERRHIFCRGVLLFGLFAAIPAVRVVAGGMGANAPSGYSSYVSPLVSGGADSPYLRTRPILDTGGAPTEGAGWLEGFRLPLLTRIRVGEYYDDNVFYSNLNRRSSFVTVVNPQFLVPMRFGKQNLGLGYSFRGSIYENASQNNYVDNYLNAFGDLEFNHRARLMLNGSLVFAHDPIGTMFSQGNVANLLSEPNEWHEETFGAQFRYGANKAKGRFDLYFNFVSRTYDNHPLLTKGRDVNGYTLGGTFYYRVMPKTSLLVQVDQILSDYQYTPPGAPSLDSLQGRYLAGVLWEPTAKTTGSLRAGYLTKDFSDSSLGAFGLPTYEAAVSWAPQTYSTFRLAASRIANESVYLGASFSDSQYYALSWNHVWLERFSSRLEVNAREDKYQNSDINNRGYGVFAGFYYKPQHWLTTGLNYFYNQRRSTRNQYDYDRNMIELNFQMNM